MAFLGGSFSLPSCERGGRRGLRAGAAQDNLRRNEALPSLDTRSEIVTIPDGFTSGRVYRPKHGEPVIQSGKGESFGLMLAEKEE
jgi:hypothetical protein